MEEGEILKLAVISDDVIGTNDIVVQFSKHYICSCVKIKKRNWGGCC
jgi:hypothetical protein